MAIITSGEGWHNNHHSDPNSASNQRHWWEIDLTYLLLRLLVLLGLAWDVQLPKCTVPRVSVTRQWIDEDTSISVEALT